MQTDEHPCREGSISAWASAGASRNQPRMPMHERLVNIIPTRNPQRKAGNACSVRLPGDRSRIVSRGWDYDRPQRRTKAKPSITFCVGDRRKSKKIPAPGEHNLHVTERHTSVTGNTCNEIQPPQNMKRSPSTLRRRSGPPTTPSSS